MAISVARLARARRDEPTTTLAGITDVRMRAHSAVLSDRVSSSGACDSQRGVCIRRVVWPTYLVVRVAIANEELGVNIEDPPAVRV